MFTPTMLYQLILDRQSEDLKHGWKACLNDEHSKGFLDCKCTPEFPTVMSRDNDPFFCRAAWQMGCHFKLVEPMLVTTPRATATKRKTTAVVTATGTAPVTQVTTTTEKARTTVEATSRAAVK